MWSPIVYLPQVVEDSRRLAETRAPILAVSCAEPCDKRQGNIFVTSDFNSKRKVGFYIKVSTERQAKVKEGSLKNQKQMLLAELNKRK